MCDSLQAELSHVVRGSTSSASSMWSSETVQEKHSFLMYVIACQILTVIDDEVRNHKETCFAPDD